MDVVYLLAVPLLFLAILVAAFVAYCVQLARGRAPQLRAVKHNQVLGPFFANFLVWMLGPIERRLLNRLSPNVITVASLLLCLVAGIIVAFGELPSAATLYLLAGVLDVLDGRIARLSGKQTKSGALLDSVCDRWGELFVLIGYAWLLHDSIWLLGALAAIGSSMMVSYTRARAEGLGFLASGGIMQRAERVILVSIGSVIAAGVSIDWPALTTPIVGASLALCGAASCATALNRFRIAYNGLHALEPKEAPAPVKERTKARPAALTTTQPSEV